MRGPHPLIKAMVALLILVLVSTLGYRVIEEWPLMDCLYMTIITLTTIGFAEIHPLSGEGRLFTIFIIVFGMGMVGYSMVSGTRFLIECEIYAILTRRISMKAIQRIQDHFIVCGFGRMGSFICHELQDRGIHFVVIDNNPEVQQRVLEMGYLLSPGDATEEEVLQAAGIERASSLVSVLESDAQNVYTVLSARELNPEIAIIARAGEESARKKLIRAGANRVINPYQIGGMRMLMGILKPTVVGFLEVVMDHRDMNIELEEIVVAEGSQYKDKKLIETDIRRVLNLIVIAIKKPDGSMVFNPGPETIVNAHDTLIVMGKRNALAIMEKNARLS